MEIGTIVTQRYPIKLYLTNIQQVRTLAFSFDSSVDQEFRMQLRAQLNDMSIDVAGIAQYGQNVQLHFSRNSLSDHALTIRCTGDVQITLQIEGENPLYTAAWCVYVLATGADWFGSHSGCSVITKSFSLEQQMLAKSLIQGIEYHRSGILSERDRAALKDFFRHAISQIADDYASKAPTLSLLPISSHQLEFVKGKTVKNITPIDLLRQLDCNVFYLNNIGPFMDMIRSTAEYKERISNFVTRLLDHVRYLPMEDIDDALASTRRELRQTYNENYQNAADEFKTKLSEKCSIGLFTAKKFRLLLNHYDEYAKDLANKGISLSVLDDFVKAFLPVYDERLRSARNAMSGVIAPNVCYLKGSSVPPQRLNWQNLNACKSDEFSVPRLDWCNNGGSMMADIVQGGYKIPRGYSCRWICSGDFAQLLGGITPSGSCVVGGLNNQLLIAFMIKE